MFAQTRHWQTLALVESAHTFSSCPGTPLNICVEKGKMSHAVMRR